MSVDLDVAKRLLEANGYVVLRAKSYRQAQERQRVAKAMQEWAEELRAGTEEWARAELGPEIRRLRERLTFVYGVACAHGASHEDLNG